MNSPQAPTPEDPAGIPWEALEDLAAGDLAPAAAASLRRRIEAEPALRQAYSEAERLERLLGLEAPYPTPIGLTQRILREIVVPNAYRQPTPLHPFKTLVRVAALVLVFFSSWMIVGGGTPALADVERAAPFAAVLPSLGTPEILPTDGDLRNLPLVLSPGRPGLGGRETIPNDPLVVATLGLVLIALGLWLARRWSHRSPATPEGAQ